MPARFSALFLLVALAGCQWEGRPDGAEAVHSTSDGYYGVEDAPQITPLGGRSDEAEVIEPLDPDAFGDYREAPVPLDQPAPTTGTADQTSEVEEALTPGTEQ